MQPEVESLGASFYAVSPALEKHGAELIASRKMRLDILTDPGNELAAKFGLRHELPEDLRGVYRGFGLDLEAANGDPSWTLPLAARYIIDPSSTIRYAHVDTVYQQRPEPEETVEALRAIVVTN